MRKIILDFMDVIDEMMPADMAKNREEAPVQLADLPENKVSGYQQLVQDYLAEKMGFPEYYGKNLDALYDCLTDLCEPTAVGFFLPTVEFDDLSIDLMLYLDRVRKVFLDAERDNPEFLAVIAAEGAGPEPEEDPDLELEDLLADLKNGGLR